ncbi:unnamed protein product [Cuscuta epithymum]|uniref:RING-type domain-containing protein n=1 Tax=Cuscuta epithymum TaxID=186058 RepID=A0AAV0C1B5_9ASTE|nr:unnamed protein product [Cuscuta epithymum]
MLVAAIVCLFLVLDCTFLIHLYTKCLNPHHPDRLSTADDDQEVSVRGLDPTVLKTIPEVEFSSKNFEEHLECAVCLCEVCDCEKVRFLPKCNHGFHVGCIDKWFQSHSTCPLCRNPIPDPNPPLEPKPEAGGASPNFPTNVLFWGDETQVSTLLGPTLEVPCSSSAAIGNTMEIVEEEHDQEESRMMTRLRSLKRLFMIRREIKDIIVDVEQGKLQI